MTSRGEPVVDLRQDVERSEVIPDRDDEPGLRDGGRQADRTRPLGG